MILAAEQAADASERPARVVPTRTLQAGLGALVAFDAGRGPRRNAAEMEEAAAGVRAGAVTRASRAATVDDVDVAEGEFLGLVDGDPVAAGEALDAVAADVVVRLVGDGADVLTVLFGDGADESTGSSTSAPPIRPRGRGR